MGSYPHWHGLSGHLILPFSWWGPGLAYKGLCASLHLIHPIKIYLFGILSLPNLYQILETTMNRSLEFTGAMSEPLRGVQGAVKAHGWGTDSDFGGVTSTSNSKGHRNDYKEQSSSSCPWMLPVLSPSKGEVRLGMKEQGTNSNTSFFPKYQTVITVSAMSRNYFYYDLCCFKSISLF